MPSAKRKLATSINTIKQKSTRSTPLGKPNLRQRASSDGLSLSKRKKLATSINTIKQKSTGNTSLRKPNARQRASSDGHSPFQTMYDIRRTSPKLHVFAAWYRLRNRIEVRYRNPIIQRRRYVERGRTNVIETRDGDE
ncbi:hypothetical protein CDAR_574421 [Caerostris darwini]|uniref:Uncharacterized protein n=1 Tax=Caerostris darwini TaxID=1538125 RepID=A0AAV4UHX6_9ARAC|nr:hypothetical protein CDAR_574421 [Caerostris darwini]